MRRNFLDAIYSQKISFQTLSQKGLSYEFMSFLITSHFSNKKNKWKNTCWEVSPMI